MSEPKKKKLTGSQGELMRVLKITPEDIEANDAGYITENQREVALNSRWHEWLGLMIAGGVFLFMPIIFMIIGFNEPDALTVMSIMSAIFALVGMGFMSGIYYQRQQIQRELDENQLETVQGIAVVNTDNNQFKLEIGDLKLNSSPAVLRRVRHLEPYVVHYLPQSKVILSMQYIDEDGAMRSDSASARLVDHNDEAIDDEDTGATQQRSSGQ